MYHLVLNRGISNNYVNIIVIIAVKSTSFKHRQIRQSKLFSLYNIVHPACNFILKYLSSKSNNSMPHYKMFV